MLVLNAESQPKTIAQPTLHNQDIVHHAILLLDVLMGFHVWLTIKLSMELIPTLAPPNLAVQL